MRLKVIGGGREFDVEVIERTSSAVRVGIDGVEQEFELEPLPDGSALIAIGGRRLRTFAAVQGASIVAGVGPAQFEFASVTVRRARGGLATPELTAPMPGKVLKVLVTEGDVVAAGQPLIVLEAMKMETALSSESPAQVKRIRVDAGQMIDHGAVLIELSPLADSSAPQSGRQGS